MASAFQSSDRVTPQRVARPFPLPGAGRADFGTGASSALSMKWSALHDAAAIVATLAGLGPEPRQPEIRNFPAIVRDAGGWRYDEARRGIDDLAALMEPGLAALLAVHARGLPAGPAAQALWLEFLAARAELLDLVPREELKRMA